MRWGDFWLAVALFVIFTVFAMTLLVIGAGLFA